MNYKKKLIPVVDVYLTGKCNYQCGYCFGEDSKYDAMPFEIFQKALDFAEFIGATIGFTGGEPLLHPKFEKIVLLCKEREVPMILRTNGMLLNKYSHLIYLFQWIGISLDGGEEVNNIMRPSTKGFKYTASDKIDIPLEIIKKIKDTNPHVNILLATVATSQNIDSLIDLADLLEEKNIKIDVWKIYQFTSNNFRSLPMKDTFKISKKKLLCIEKELKHISNLNIIVKYGKGNCLLIDTKGEFRINDTIIGNLVEDYESLYYKILTSKEFELLVSNKMDTYRIK